MEKNSKIYVAGHKGLVGSALWKNLEMKGYSSLIGRGLDELDLTNQEAVSSFFREERPEYVFLAAAKVGGIFANNTYRAQFIYENLMIQNNVIHHAYLNGVKKLLFLGSTCIYPREAPQPMPEDCLLSSPLEYTNEPYAIAKIAGIKMCESYSLQYACNFISVMPTNLYGPQDNFNLETSHVLPALLRKIHLAKSLLNSDFDLIRRDLDLRPIEGVNGQSENAEIVHILEKYGVSKGKVEIWGSGKALREFLWSEEMADACVFIMENVDFHDLRGGNQGKEIRNTHINIGTGEELSIGETAFLIKEILGYEGDLFFNTEKPDGTLRKLNDVRKLHSLGWKHKIGLREGVVKLYDWYINN